MSSCRYKRGTWPLSRVPHQWADRKGVAVEAMTGNRSPGGGRGIGWVSAILWPAESQPRYCLPHLIPTNLKSTRWLGPARVLVGWKMGTGFWTCGPLGGSPAQCPCPLSHVAATFPPGAEHIHRSGCWGIRDDVFSDRVELRFPLHVSSNRAPQLRG